jgi:hypothetical protein
MIQSSNLACFFQKLLLLFDRDPGEKELNCSIRLEVDMLA